ncbi:VOC family protein [Amycolatopsis jejuensis]|uniref:VOC family protein n=1 Tax=Amycolatopsis jejuensis TaxID=330084 RepID=UPI0005241DEA|nr:VOC family protein [Amycolatopsis jejuensis]
MSTSNARPATVGWFEITATEPSLSRSYYQELFGWSFESPGDAKHYWTITAPGSATAMGALRSGERDTTCIGVVSAEMAATVRKLESLGATIAERPARTPAGDLHAVAIDLQGNRIGLIEPAPRDEPGPRHAAPGLNALAFFEIGTTDLVATQRFYQAAFGWTTERDEAAEGVAYYHIRPAGSPDEIGGMLDLTGIAGATGYAIPGLRVADVGDVLERAEKAGGRTAMGPVADANGVVAGQFLDPVGNRWSTFSLPQSR